MNRSSRAWLEFALTRVLVVATDAVALALAYVAAFAVRFDFHEPAWGWRAVAISFVTVCAVHVLALLVCGAYRRSCRCFTASEVPRLVLAAAVAGVVLTLGRYLLGDVAFASVRPPYSVTLLTFFFASAALVGVRVLIRLRHLARASEAPVLARTASSFDAKALARFFTGKCVLVTGAGGSIGSEIVRQVAFAGARRVVLAERSEFALYEIDRDLRARRPSAEIASVLADCTDEPAMRALFARERPDVVLHAAAYKHVPLVEANAEAGWRNNVASTDVLARLAKESGVARFVLISTDKAVNPVSEMGKSKREAERVLLKAEDGQGTSFAIVRFGNVYGSSGSVVPLFREQIAKGGPVTVTHPDMRRYFMSVEEAVGLVLLAATRAERGVVYTLDMGASVGILDLAEDLIRQAGLRPYVDIPIVFTGIRPGERLEEDLGLADGSVVATDMAKIHITYPK